jgi:hypothetical protein
MKRIMAAALLAAASVGVSLLGAEAKAQSAKAEARLDQAAQSDIAPRHRRLRRVPIYRSAPDHWEPDVIPRYNPGPNAVRTCSVAYVEEHRPSGTVITPHMSCHWRPG